MNKTIADALKKQGIVVDPKSALAGIELDVDGVLGSTMVKIDNLLRVGRGSVLELDQTVTSPIELKVGEATVAYGEVFIRDDDSLALRVIRMVGD